MPSVQSTASTSVQDDRRRIRHLPTRRHLSVRPTWSTETTIETAESTRQLATTSTTTGLTDNRSTSEQQSAYPYHRSRWSVTAEPDATDKHARPTRTSRPQPSSADQLKRTSATKTNHMCEDEQGHRQQWMRTPVAAQATSGEGEGVGEPGGGRDENREPALPAQSRCRRRCGEPPSENSQEPVDRMGRRALAPPRHFAKTRSKSPPLPPPLFTPLQLVCCWGDASFRDIC